MAIPGRHVHMFLTIRRVVGWQVLLVGTRAGSKSSMAEVSDIVSRTSGGTPIFLQLKPPREQPFSKDVDAADGPHEVLRTLHLVTHC